MLIVVSVVVVVMMMMMMVEMRCSVTCVAISSSSMGGGRVWMRMRLSGKSFSVHRDHSRVVFVIFVVVTRGRRKGGVFAGSIDSLATGCISLF